MKKAIYKYNLELDTGAQNILMLGVRPKVVHVDIQHERVTLWVEVDPADKSYVSTFKIVATGETYAGEDDWEHVGTFMQYNGSFVWHVLQAVKL